MRCGWARGQRGYLVVYGSNAAQFICLVHHPPHTHQTTDTSSIRIPLFDVTVRCTSPPSFVRPHTSYAAGTSLTRNVSVSTTRPHHIDIIPVAIRRTPRSYPPSTSRHIGWTVSTACRYPATPVYDCFSQSRKSLRATAAHSLSADYVTEDDDANGDDDDNAVCC